MDKHRCTCGVMAADGHVRLRVLFDYKAAEDDECSLRAGDIVMGHRMIDQWWQGESGGKTGLFPSNYVQRCGEESKIADPSDVKVEAGAAVEPSEPPPPSGLSQFREFLGKKASVAAAAKAPRPGKRVNTLRYGEWEWNMAITAGAALFALSIPAIVWAEIEPEPDGSLKIAEYINSNSSLGVGLLALFVGPAILAYEWRVGYIRAPGSWAVDKRLPLKGILYILASIAFFTSVPLVLAAFFLLCAGVVECITVYKGEQYDDLGETPRKPQRDATDERITDAKSSWERAQAWYTVKREQGEIGKLLVIFVYTVISLILFFDALARWQRTVSAQQNSSDPAMRDKALSGWAPWAKACGQLLNFNCALIGLPVIRSVVKFLHNRLISSGGGWSNFIPLQKNVIFHKTVSLAVLAFTVGHAFAHLMNFAHRPQPTTTAFEHHAFGGHPWPWVTGFFITVAMFFIYTAGRDRVRRAHYEIFWFNHHWFIVFWIGILFHGPVFWAWFLLPGVLYVGERIFREMRGKHPIYVKTVKWIPPVYEIQFEPKDHNRLKFKEGMYVYLNCPHVSKNEWHPFTISSAHGDLEREGYISVHIKVHKGGWTDRVKQYFELMNPKGEYPLVLRRQEGNQVLLGKDKGVDGKQLLRVDGPHSAPSQHYDEYPVSMVVGAGIGMTPAAASIRAIIKHRWKKGFPPNRVYFYWVVRHSEVASFQWFIAKLTNLMNEVAHARKTGNIESFQDVQIHIYISRFDADNLESMELLETQVSSQDPALPIPQTFSIRQLWAHMTRPNVRSSAQAEVMQNPEGAANRLGDIYVWNGRPQWEQVFEYVRDNRPQDLKHIGCTFCGAAVIGKELKRMCHRYSSVDDVIFHLHKENF